MRARQKCGSRVHNGRKGALASTLPILKEWDTLRSRGLNGHSGGNFKSIRPQVHTKCSIWDRAHVCTCGLMDIILHRLDYTDTI